MFFKERRHDRRRRYSLQGHLKRLAASGRLRELGAGSLILVVVAGLTLARCQSDSITGPATVEQQPGALPSLSVEKTALAIFPSSLLPAVHPCHPDLTFVEMGGQNEILYTDEVYYDEAGKRKHKVRYKPHAKQQGKDSRGKAHKGESRGCGDHDEDPKTKDCFFIKESPGGPSNSVAHMTVKEEDSSAETCTTTTNSGGMHGGGNACPMNSSPKYEFMLIEDPITFEGTLTVTVLDIVSSCPLTTVAAAFD